MDQLAKFMAQFADTDDSTGPVDSGGHETTGRPNYLPGAG